jgi:hypothetical protein
LGGGGGITVNDQRKFIRQYEVQCDLHL